MNVTVQIRQRGALTLPAALRQKYDIQAGDTLHVLDLDGVFVLTRMTPIVPQLAQEIERLRLEAGLDTADLLHALREQREQYHLENHVPTHDG